MSAIRNIGIVGLGKMGLPMAKHLLANGFKVAGCDPVEHARAAARAAGVSIANSPREIANVSDLVIVVVGFDSEVETVVFGKAGIAEATRSGLIVALGSTVAPRYAAKLAGQLASARHSARARRGCRRRRQAAHLWRRRREGFRGLPARFQRFRLRHLPPRRRGRGPGREDGE
jgi:hypothetical protein